jgi:PAS domain S-box-containing protein
MVTPVPTSRDGAFWRHVVDVLAEGVLVRDGDGRISYVNPAAARILGLDRERLLGAGVDTPLGITQTLEEDGSPFDRANVPTIRALQSNEPVRDTVMGVDLPDRGLRWIWSTATPMTAADDGGTSVVTMFFDVTERHDAQAASREADARFRTAVENMLDGFAIYRAQRDASGTIVDLICEYVNASATENRGLPASEQIGRGILEVFPELREQGLFQRYAKVIETGKPMRLDLPWYESARVEGSFELRAAKFGDGCVVAFRDVTDLRQTTAELARSNLALSEFAAVAAHDLSEPLRGLSGFVELLAQQYCDRLDADARRWIEHIARGADQMRSLIDNLLAYSRAGADLPMGPTDLNETVGEACDALAGIVHDTGASIDVAQLPIVRGNRTQLVQLFQNVLTNALKFTAPEVTPRVTISVAEDDGRPYLRVADNGIGVEPEQRERVFEPFHRAHTTNDVRGSGLGLAICKRIIDRHRGRIWIESNPGGGSVVCMVVPRAEQEPNLQRFSENRV